MLTNQVRSTPRQGMKKINRRVHVIHLFVVTLKFTIINTCAWEISIVANYFNARNIVFISVLFFNLSLKNRNIYVIEYGVHLFKRTCGSLSNSVNRNSGELLF